MRLAIGAPFAVDGTTDDAVERGRQQLERALQELEARTSGAAASSRP